MNFAISIRRAAGFPVAIAVLLHLSTMFRLEGDLLTKASAWLFLFSVLPYTIACIALWRLKRYSYELLCGIGLMLIMDIVTYLDVFYNASSSTSAIALLLMPYANMVVFFPIGIALGRFLERRKKPPDTLLAPDMNRRMRMARYLIIIIGVLLPYLARIPGTLIKGPHWFTQYLGTGLLAVVFLSVANAMCWGAVLFTTRTLHRPSSVWFPAVLGFSLPAVAHAFLDLASDAQAGVALFFIPMYSLPLVGLGWWIALRFEKARGTTLPNQAL